MPEHATVVYTPNAPRFVRQHWFDGGPFIVAEFMAHDSKLQFQSLNHASSKRHQPAIARGGVAKCFEFTSALDGIADAARLAAGSTSRD